MLHQDVLQISYKHRYEIKKVFKEILGLYNIDHFALDLVRPDGEMIFLSATPSHGYEICKRGWGKFDGIIAPEYYENYEFYWWKDARHKDYAKEINYIRHVKHQFTHGFMLVRKLDDFYFVYSFATKNSDPYFPSLIVNKLNELFGVGDYIYNEMRETYAEYTGIWTPPLIEEFYPFQGGKPAPRYSKYYKKTEAGVLLPSDDVQSREPKAGLRLIIDNSRAMCE